MKGNAIREQIGNSYFQLHRFRPPAANTVRHQRTRAFVKISAVALTYWATSIAMVFVNKYLVGVMPLAHNASDVTLFVTWIQCLVAAAGSSVHCLLCSSRRICRTGFRDCFRPAIILNSVVFVAMLVLNNLCLQQVTVSFYQVVKSLTLVFVVIFQAVLLGQPSSCRIIICCIIIALGFVVGTRQEGLLASDFHLVGCAFGVASSLFVALNGILMKYALPTIDNDSVRLARSCNVNATVIFLPFLLVSSLFLQVDRWTSLLAYPHFWALTLISGLMSFAIGWISAIQIDITSPLTHHIIANTKAVLQTFIAIYYNGESKSLLWFVGDGMIVTGALTYAVFRVKEDKVMSNKATHFGKYDIGSFDGTRVITKDGDGLVKI